jgi:predicted membrane protein
MSERGWEPARFNTEIRWLFQAAIVIFLVTVIIGILNGLDLVEFDRPTLLTHVHAGTMGWITLSLFGASLWFFSADDPASRRQVAYVRWLTIVSVVAIPLYVFTFYLGKPKLAPFTGSLALLVIAGFFGWVALRSRRDRLSVPRLAILAALTTLIAGAVFGVLLQIFLAGGLQSLPVGVFIAHPSTMVTGYLILAGMGVAEWGLTSGEDPRRLNWLGIAQVALPFLGGVSLTVGALIDNFMLIIMIAPLQLLGVFIFLGRLGSRIVRARWLEGTSNRLFALSGTFLAVNVGIIAYLAINYAEDFEQIPSWLIFALDHSIFMGVLTNGLFALIYEISRSRRGFWPWADHVLFWGMNFGLVGFVVGLIRQEALLKQIFTPIMGTSILLALLTYTIRLSARPSQGEGHVVGPAIG